MKKVDQELEDLLSEFATDVDGVTGDLNNHDLDMNGWSQEVNLLIADIIPKIKAVTK